MADENWQEVKPLIDETGEMEQPTVHTRETSPTNKKELLQSLYQQELEIISAVANYPKQKVLAQIADDLEIANNPSYRQVITIETDSLQGLIGFRPLHSDFPMAKKATVQLERILDTTGFLKNPFPEYGVNTNIGLKIGAYSDEETLGQMREYVRLHPEFAYRLRVAIGVDAEGNAVKSFYVPRDFPIDKSNRRAIKKVDGNGRSKDLEIFDDLGPNDIELMQAALAMLYNRLPEIK